MLKGKYGFLGAGGWEENDHPVEVRSPYDNRLISRVCLATEKDIRLAIGKACGAFQVTKKLSSRKRRDNCLGVARGIEDRFDEFVEVLSLDAGKPVRTSRLEVARAVNTFEIAAEEAQRLGGELLPIDITPVAEPYTAITRRFPIGPASFISPYNWPLNLVAHKAAPALAVGSAFVLKPATSTPLTSLMLAEVILKNCDLPAGSVHVLPCRREEADLFSTDPRIKLLSFTGSPEVGWKLKERAGKKKVVLELGGNAAVVVHHDADIDEAVARCVAGSFSYAGQVCISVQRIYVQEKAYDEFKEKFVRETEKLKVGDPLEEVTDVGPMIDEGNVRRLADWVKEAEQRGACVLSGNKYSGTLFHPTILENVPVDCRIHCREAFGPVAVLGKYSTFREAVEKVNDSEFGLQAGIFTRDAHNIFYAFENLDVGGVIAGDVPTTRVDNMPYGGVKDSGFGREGVKYAMEDMTEWKVLVMKHMGERVE